ncbi:MAG: amino acid permease [Elusimicrobia bacterium]|nr:amino acid permease [Elusimicrobiota bacterium]
MKKELRLFDILCLGVNAIVGSGIYLFPGLLAGRLGPASVLAFPLCGLMLTPVALCFAWLASRTEKTGGPYVYAQEAFGPWIGYGVGWLSWVMQVLSFAAVANAIGAYLGHFSDALGSTAAVKIVAGAVVLLLGILNYRGIRPAAKTTDFFTIAKLIPLVLFIVIGFGFIRPEHFSPFAPHGLMPMSQAIFFAFFACQGFEHTPVPAGEAKNPKRDIPLAAVGSLLGATLLYSLIQSVAVGSYPDLAGSTKPLAQAAAFLWAPLGALMAIGASISTLGYTTGAALTTPRYLFALGGSGFFPRWFEGVHQKYQSPYRAIAATTAVVFVLAMFLDFKKLVDLSNVTTATQYLITCAAALKLSRQGKNASWSLPLGSAAPLLGIGVILYLSSQAKSTEIIASAGALALGLLLAAVYRNNNARRPAAVNPK